MRRLLVALLLALTACAEGDPPAGVLLEGSFTVPAEALAPGASADELGYLLRLPAGYYEGSGPWPLLVSLHGSGDVDNDAAWVASAGLPAAFASGDEPVPAVVLAPRSVPGLAWSDEVEALAALISDVGSRFRIDPAAVVATGIDTGAEGAMVLAARYPDLIRGVFGVSTTVTVPLADGGLCDLRAPVRLVHGRDDLLFPLPDLRQEVGAIEERCGFDIDLHVVDGGHFATMSAAYRDPAFPRWLAGVLAR